MAVAQPPNRAADWIDVMIQSWDQAIEALTENEKCASIEQESRLELETFQTRARLICSATLNYNVYA
jgi:hypothetical protein